MSKITDKVRKFERRKSSVNDFEPEIEYADQNDLDEMNQFIDSPDFDNQLARQSDYESDDNGISEKGTDESIYIRL